MSGPRAFSGAAVCDVVPHSRSGGQRNLPIQWLRAAAALMVLLHHAGMYQGLILHREAVTALFPRSWGHFGVCLFFAISGYLMATAIRVQEPVPFLSHRIARIYPPFLFMVAAYWVQATLCGQWLPIDPKALTLVPMGNVAYPLGVEWTLVCEVTFYVSVFAAGLLKWAPSIGRIAALWLMVLAACDLIRLVHPGFLIGKLTVSDNVAMAGGLLVPAVARSACRPLPLALAGLGVWAWAAATPDSAFYQWLAGIGGAMIVAAAIRLSALRPEFGSGAVGRCFARCGDYSYALYLCHVPVIRLVYTQLPELPAWVLVPAAIACALATGALLGTLDLASYRQVKTLLRRISPLVLRGGVTLYVAAFVSLVLFQYRNDVLDRENTVIAANLARSLAGNGRIATPWQADEVAARAGLRPAPELDGSLDTVAWTSSGLGASGWAIDGGKHASRVFVALFQDGALLGSTIMTVPRFDIRRQHRARLDSGFALTLPAACRPGRALVAVALTADRRYAVLSDHNAPVACP